MTEDGLGNEAGLATEAGLVGATLELTVGAVAHGGHCVSRSPAPGASQRSLRSEERTLGAGTGGSDGRVIFVRHALPGEQVRAVVTEEHTSYLRADTVEVLTASPHRVTPPCPYAGVCGGCDWQHADLAYQRALKTDVVREQLRRLGGLSESEVDGLGFSVRPVPPVAGEPDGQGWRTRVQYTVDSTGRAGLLAHRSHQVVPVDRCLIAHATVRDSDVLSRAWPEHDAVEVVGPTVHARRAGSAPVLVSGPAAVTERAVGREWRLDPTVFWQVHPAAADTLAADVVELLAPRPGERIWDLYGGAGLFAAALAQSGASQRGTSEERTDRAGRGPAPHAGATGRITVVEGDGAAVAAARENLRDLTTVTVRHSDVGRGLRNPRWREVDLVILDPPRTGAGAAVVASIAGRTPRAIAYVACDPATLARDVATFRSHGYGLVTLRAYDLFPHTHHVECMALLTPLTSR